MDKKKIGIIALLAVVLAVGIGAVWWLRGTADRAQEKLDLAVKYIWENDYEKAILAYNEAIKIDPKQVKAYQGLGRVYTLQGKYGEAKAAYDKGTNAVPANDQNTLRLGLAGMYIDQGQLADAERTFQEIINGTQNCLEAYWGLAMVYQKQGDNAKAETVLRQTVAKYPNDYRCYNTLALYLKQNNKADDAFNNLVQSLSIDINQQEAYLVLNGMYKERWNELQAKLSGVSNQQVAAMLEFYMYYSSGDKTKAINSFNSKINGTNGNHKAHILYAIVMLNAADKAGAENIISQVLTEKFNDWLLSDLALYYKVAGDNDKARLMAIKAIQANGTNLDAIALLQELNKRDQTSQIYAAEYLLYNWKPVGDVRETMAISSVTMNSTTPDAGLLSFIKTYLSEYQRAEDYSITRGDLTGDNIPELILTDQWAFVIKDNNGSYQLLYLNKMGHYGYQMPYVDSYGDLHLTPISGGTGAHTEERIILRWDGSQLKEIWNGYTVMNSYADSRAGSNWSEKTGIVTVTGISKPQKLIYVLNGVYGHWEAKYVKVKERTDQVIREYVFDEQQFKFVEKTSPVIRTLAPTESKDQKLVLLNKAAEYCYQKYKVMPKLEPPYGNPKPCDPVVLVKEMTKDYAEVGFGDYQTDNGVIFIFRLNPAGEWEYEKDLVIEGNY